MLIRLFVVTTLIHVFKRSDGVLRTAIVSSVAVVSSTPHGS